MAEQDPSIRSPRAFAHFRKLVEDSNTEEIKLRTDIVATDWLTSSDHLTRMESLVYGIDPRLLHSLSLAHLRYEELVGVCDVEFAVFREEERAAYPEYFHGDCIRSTDDAAAFMAVACQVPSLQAILWVSRVEVQRVRSRIYEEFTTSPPHWLYGRTKFAY